MSLVVKVLEESKFSSYIKVEKEKMRVRCGGHEHGEVGVLTGSWYDIVLDYQEDRFPHMFT